MHTVIIPAAGSQERWGHPSVKQLADIGGEAIVERLLRQAKRVTNTVIVVTHRPAVAKRAWVADAATVNRGPDTALAETLLASAKYWGDRTTILLGDVVFTRHAIDRVLNTKHGAMFYRRADELFAVSFGQGKQQRMLNAIQQVWELKKIGKGRGKLVNIHRVFAGFDVTERKYSSECYTILNHPTRDFDKHWQYVDYIDRVVKTGKLDDMPPSL